MTQNKYFSGLWYDIPWNLFQKKTYQLQKRIYKASKNNNKVQVISLQKQLFGTYEARMIAIRQVTQLNDGKKTAGIDGLSSLTMKQRFDLEKDLAEHAKRWKHMELRQINIPKPGTSRLLKRPTIRDRAWQCLVKLVTEPAHEATCHSKSYGFRTGRSTHDAQKIIFSNLHSRSNGQSKRIIELDIEKWFDRINHTTILNEIIAPRFIKNSLFECLKSGHPRFLNKVTRFISPLLANIALNGIEKIHPSVRYADDMIFFLKPDDNEKQILSSINTFLADRGMNISKKKTKMTTTTSGFDFLGWHFIVQPNGFKCFPSKNNYTELKKKVKAIANNSAYGVSTKSAKIAPIIRGWRNYHKYCDMSKHNLWSTHMEKSL
jgi:RNA-directed DNA polymerase